MKIFLKLVISIVVGFIGFILIPGILWEKSRRPNVTINMIIWGITGAFLIGVWKYGSTESSDSDNHQLKKD